MPDAHDPVEDPRPDDADDGPRAAVRPGLRADLAALPGEPGPARGRVRPGLVQADAPRHGPDPALPRTAGPAGDAALAGPGPRRRPRAGRRRGRRRRSRPGSSTPGCRSPSSSPPRGRRPRRSAAATSAAARTGRASASSRSAAGRSTTPTRWRRCCARWKGSRSRSTAPRPGQEDLARRPRSCSAAAPPSSRPPGPPATTSGPLHARAARTPRRSRPTSESFAALEPTADGFRNYRGKGAPAAVGVPAGRPGEPADPERARDDRPRRRPAGAGRELRAVPARRPHRPARVADQRLLREPARHGHGVEADVRGRGDLRGPRPRHRRGQVDRAAASTSSSARTPSCGPSRRSTRATTRGRSSCATSWPRGTRS